MMGAEWSELLTYVVEKVVYLAVLTFVYWIYRLYNKYITNKFIREIVIDGIMYAQETLWENHGEARFDAAKRYILDTLKRYNIKYSEEQLNCLIESILFKLRAEYGYDEWYSRDIVEGSRKSVEAEI